MDIQADLAAIERRCQRNGVPILTLCREADIDPSTWYLWRQGRRAPLLATWQRVNAAADRIAPRQKRNRKPRA